VKFHGQLSEEQFRKTKSWSQQIWWSCRLLVCTSQCLY